MMEVRKMRLVILESPFAGDLERNRIYLDRCIRDCLARGESPYASHRMLTSALDDLDPVQRKAGIEAGFAWRKAADATVVYRDYGTSRGMQAGIDHAVSIGHRIECREIGPNPPTFKRDPDADCEAFETDVSKWRQDRAWCRTDGHHLCKTCVHRSLLPQHGHGSNPETSR
jgi:hypothetical protein